MTRMAPSLLAAGLLLGMAGGPARAHEPLWGETAQTFAFDIIHPATRFGFDSMSRLYQGSDRIANPDDLKMSRQENVFSLQYSPQTTLNVRLEIPYVRVTSEQRVDGQLRQSRASGMGDVMLSAKSRFRADFGPDWKTMHAYTVGLQLPTGERNGREPDGTPLLPSEQPGTGNWGVLLGYAFAYERLQDTTWASALYSRDLEGGSRRGDMLTLDAAYGYWVRRANRPQDLGVILAAGPRLQVMGKDRVSGQSDRDSGSRMAGLHTTLIATKDKYQGRIGLLVPVYQRYNGTQLGSGLEFRAGLEALF